MAINCSVSVKFTLIILNNMVNQSRIIIEFFKAYFTRLNASIEIIFVQVDDQSWMIGFQLQSLHNSMISTSANTNLNSTLSNR